MPLVAGELPQVTPGRDGAEAALLLDGGMALPADGELLPLPELALIGADAPPQVTLLDTGSLPAGPGGEAKASEPGATGLPLLQVEMLFRRQATLATPAATAAPGPVGASMQSTEATELLRMPMQPVLPVALPESLEQSSAHSLPGVRSEAVAALAGLGSQAGPVPPQSVSPGLLNAGLAPTVSDTGFAEELQRATPTEQRLPVPVGDPRWSESVGQRLNWMASNGVNRAEIQLDPPELGRVHVELQVKGDSVQVQFASDQGLVRDTLESAMPRLRELMSQAGFSEMQFGVADQQRGDGQARQSSGDAAAATAAGNGETEAGAEVSGMNTTLLGQGLVDYFA